ncbi:MAG: universal stress protein [Actinomycetia bacterium]|nr:universal stress protein [Actinomycetes bacterium]
MYDNIILPTDHYSNEPALGMAGDLAWMFDACLVVLTALPTPDDMREEIEEKLVAAGRDGLEFKWDTHEPPEKAIPRLTRELDRPLVCMSTAHMANHGPLTKSVAERVVADVDVPVALLGPHCPSTGARHHLTELVACVDGSDFADESLPLAMAWALESGLPVRVLSVVPDNELPSADLIHERERVLLAPDQVECTILQGDPATAVANWSRGHPGALLFASTHGRTGRDLRKHPSVAGHLVSEASLPVVAVHPKTAHVS